MTNIFVISDTHFGHQNILKFTRDDGTPLRPGFTDIAHHDEMMVKWWNELVAPADHIYHLGDVAINKRSVEIVRRLNGHKRLVRGNHDIFDTSLYIDVGFDEIYGVRVFPKHNYILSHVPLHPDSLSSRSWINIHGHTHARSVLLPNGVPDQRYRCVSVEHTDYRPILLMR